MKKLILFLAIVSAIACKKDSADEDVTKYNWVLNTATVSPAITINGKTSTDYKNILGEHSCYASNYTINFLENGLFTISSTGALCDMIPNSDQFKWTRDGNELTLNYGNLSETFTLNGNTMAQVKQINYQGTNHSLTLKFSASKK